MISPKLYVAKVRAAAAYIRSRVDGPMPKLSLTLGSGMDDLADQMAAEVVIQYRQIPGFPGVSAPGHKGELIYGTIVGVPVFALSGREHYYNASPDPRAMWWVTFAVQVIAELGVQIHMSTNAVGAANMSYKVGDLMVVTDHIGLVMPNPLLGEHLNFGSNWYFQPMHPKVGTYDLKLRRMFHRAATGMRESRRVHEGVLFVQTGRTYETPAEVRAIRILGGDAMGMSTAPEVIVATNRYMRTLAVSIVSNTTKKNGTNATNHEEVVRVLKSPPVRHRVAKIFLKFFELYRQSQ